MNIDSIMYSHSYVQMKVIKFDWGKLEGTYDVCECWVWILFEPVIFAGNIRRGFPTTGLKMIWTLKSFVVALGCDKVLYSVHTKFNLCFQERQIIDVESAARLILDSISRFLTYSHCSYFFLFVPMCSYCLSPFLAICFTGRESLQVLSPYLLITPYSLVLVEEKMLKWSCLGSFTKGNPAVPKKPSGGLVDFVSCYCWCFRNPGVHHLGCIKTLMKNGINMVKLSTTCFFSPDFWTHQPYVVFLVPTSTIEFHNVGRRPAMNLPADGGGSWGALDVTEGGGEGGKVLKLPNRNHLWWTGYVSYGMLRMYDDVLWCISTTVCIFYNNVWGVHIYLFTCLYLKEHEM